MKYTKIYYENKMFHALNGFNATLQERQRKRPGWFLFSFLKGMDHKKERSCIASKRLVLQNPLWSLIETRLVYLD